MPESRIACSLSPEEQERRFAAFAEIARRALLGAERKPQGAEFTLANTDVVATAVQRLIAAERECCSFLEFNVETSDEALVIDVSGPPQARELIERLFAIEPAVGMPE